MSVRLVMIVLLDSFTEITKGVVIGDRTKVQSHSFICDMVTIGDDCFHRPWRYVHQ